MTLTQTSDAQSGDSPAHLAATESPVLASQHVNGLYNEGHVESIPHTEMKITLWDLVIAEWRTIGMIIAPFALAIAAYMIPASRGELTTVRTEAAANLDLAKAQTSGQLQSVNTKIDALQSSVTETKSGLLVVQSDIKEVLKRLPDPRQLPVLTASTAPIGNPPQDNLPEKTYPPQKLHKAVKKKPVQPVAAKSNSGFRLW